MISDEKLPKRERIQKTGDFKKVYRAGLSVRKPPVVLYYLPTTLGYSRIGFSISARSIKRATRRNRIKRLFKEAYRKNKTVLKNGFDLVISLRKDLRDEELEYSCIQKIFCDLCLRAGLSG